MVNQQGPRFQGGGPPRGGGPRPPEPAPQPSPADLKAIIQDGDSEKLVKWAETLGEPLSRQVTTAQIRGIFGSVRRIEMNWSRKASEAESKAAVRQLLLLKPKMAYASQRVRGVGSLRNVLTPAIDLIEGKRDRFANFVDFFEAIVAYHKAYGGRD